MGLAIAARGLGRSFRGLAGVSGIGVSVGPGDVLALVGADGGGKSTTLRMLSGLLRPDAGEGNRAGVRRAGRRSCTRAAHAPQRIALHPTCRWPRTSASAPP